jgi:hypothetical protein
MAISPVEAVAAWGRNPLPREATSTYSGRNEEKYEKGRKLTNTERVKPVFKDLKNEM